MLHLPIHDLLHYHIALVLQAAVDAEGEAGQMYAETLADALTVHFLRRYAAAQPARREVTGGLPRTSCDVCSPISRPIWRRSSPRRYLPPWRR